MAESATAKRPKTLPPIRPNVGIEAAYRRKLQAYIAAMNDSIQYWLGAAYKANDPHIAMDELPAAALKRAIRMLGRRWQRKFDKLATELADHFAKAVQDRSASALKSILKRNGFTVEFKMTPAMQDILRATINENVALIKSIPAQYMIQVEGSVMRSVTAGRDLGSLAKELTEHYGVSKRRAALIARTQNNLTTASMTRARQLEVGVTEAVWLHSGGGRHPRPSHLKAGRDKQRYDVREGWLDPDVGRKIFPGELINCRCVSKAVVPGFAA